MFYVYILKSIKNSKTYVGMTSKSVYERLIEHNSGVSKFTRGSRPWKLVYFEEYTCKKCAQKRERFYKTGVGKKLKKLIIENMNVGA